MLVHVNIFSGELRGEGRLNYSRGRRKWRTRSLLAIMLIGSWSFHEIIGGELFRMVGSSAKICRRLICV